MRFCTTLLEFQQLRVKRQVSLRLSSRSWCWCMDSLAEHGTGIRLGYNVTTLDFRAAGIDLTDISKIETFEQYTEPLDQFMTSLGVNEKVVLVGHSAAGIHLTKTLHDYADKIHVAVYISATMLEFGYLTCEHLQIGVPGFIESKCNASCPNLPEPTCFDKTLMGPKEIPLISYTEGFALRKLLQRPGPYRVLVTTNFTEAAKTSAADQVPRVYIKTSLDKTLTPTMQDAMINLWPPCEVLEVYNDHDVPFEKPELISALIANATSYMARLLFSFVFLLIISNLFLFVYTAVSTNTTEASACRKATHPPTAQKPKVVLVHGFTSGGWFWFKVRYILESFGYNVTAIDLKASGLDPTDVYMIKTFEQYNEPLDRFMATLPRNEKVVLVGHSAGGVSITRTLLDHPHKVLVAVYVAATMLKSGYLTCEDLQIGVPHFSESKCNAMCPKLPKQAVKKSSRLADKVPRVYVKTRFDQTMIPEQQAAMIKRWPPCEVHEMDNDHDAPFAKPTLLSALIVNATSYIGAR
ncbi:hypothetical protein V2J09_012122 [Rumex salicifolius]